MWSCAPRRLAAGSEGSCLLGPWEMETRARPRAFGRADERPEDKAKNDDYEGPKGEDL